MIFSTQRNNLTPVLSLGFVHFLAGECTSQAQLVATPPFRYARRYSEAYPGLHYCLQDAVDAVCDLSRIAPLDAIFYIIMDIAVHWVNLRHLREEIDASSAILITTIVLDLVVIFLGELLFLCEQHNEAG